MASLKYKNFLQGIGIIPKALSQNGALGDLEVLNTTNTLNFHNGTSSSQTLTVAHAAQGTLKVLNKDLDDSTTRIINGTTTPKAVKFDVSGATNSTTTTLDFNQTVNRTITFQDATDTVVCLNTIDILTNKTLTAPVINNATADTITGIAGGPFLLQSASGQNLSLQAQGVGVVTLESFTFDGAVASGNNLSVSSTGTLGLTASTTLTLTGTSGVKVVGPLLVNEVVDNTTTGANANVPAPTSPYITFTGALTSIDTIVNNTDNSFLVLTNRTGGTVNINNDTGSIASNRVITGTGSFLTLDNNASIMLAYSTSNSRWMVVGGTGGGNASVNLIAGENISAGQAVYVSTGTGTDSGRTAGRVYKVDATNDDRIEFCGFAANTATTGNTIRIQTIGGLTGLVGLSVGKPIYASVTSPGDIQTTAPIAVNQWIIPIGIATSTTAAVINGAGSSTAVKITGSVLQGLYADVLSVSANTLVTNANSVVLVNASGGTVTITVPSASSPSNIGKIFTIKKTDSSANAVTIATLGGNIDGVATQTLPLQYDSFMFVSDGTNYNII